jgi:hypothetical protein
MMVLSTVCSCTTASFEDADFLLQTEVGFCMEKCIDCNRLFGSTLKPRYQGLCQNATIIESG